MKSIYPWTAFGLTIILLLSGFAGSTVDSVSEEEDIPEGELPFEQKYSDHEKSIIGTEESRYDLEDQWRWLYDHEHRTEPENAVGLTGEGVWYGGIRLDLSHDVGAVMTEVAYYDFEAAAEYVKAHVAEDDGGAPGDWIASSDEYQPTGDGWVELSLDQAVLVEDPGQYWAVLEIDDLGDDHFPFGCIPPFVLDGQYINTEDPEDPGDWGDLKDDNVGGAWSLEVRVESVETLPADEMNAHTVTLNGDLHGKSAEVFFRYRKRGSTTWSETTPVQVGSGEFSDTITDLEPLEQYEFKAVADLYGEEVVGETLYFTPAHVSRTTQVHEEWNEYDFIENLRVEEDDLRLDTEEDREETYGFEGESETVDVSDIVEMEITMFGAGGGGGGYEEGGDGGYVSAVIDVSDFEELEIWVGEGGYYNSSGGWGRSEGGDGGYNAGGGGGSTEIWADGTFLAAADAGGGGCEFVVLGDRFGGGGGARGGEGGYGVSGSGDDAEGGGHGGDGGESYPLGLGDRTPGGPGGGGVNPDHVIADPEVVMGGGSSGGSTGSHGDHGSVEVSYLKNHEEGVRISEPLSLNGIEDVEDSLITWGQNVPSDTDITVYTAITEDGSEPSDWDQAQDNDTIPSISAGDDLDGKYLWTRQVLSTTDGTATPLLHDLTVAVMDSSIGTFDLTIESDQGGTTYPSPDTYTYDEGAEVTVGAVPDEDWAFDEWTGDVPPGEEESKEITLTMDDHKSLTAHFSIQEFELTIDSTNGGEVLEPGEGTFHYAYGEMVELEALAEEHHHFVEWIGDVEEVEDPSANSTTIEILDNYTITANFDVDSYTLTLDSSEGGTVTGPGEGNFTYDAFEEVELTVLADEGHAFIEWVGDVENIENTKLGDTSVEMLGNYSITAEFDSDFYELTIDSSQGGTTHPEPGLYSYREGTEVEVQAIPDEGFYFVNWTGDHTEGEKEEKNITLVMDENKSVTAHFEKLVYELIIGSTEGGEVIEPGEDTYEYEHGEELTIEAVAYQDHNFLAWAGDTDGIEDPESNITTLKMLDDYNITAYFAMDTYELTVESTEGGEVVEPGEGTFDYALGTEVELEAAAGPGYHFVEWTGDVDNVEDPGSHETTIIMESDHEITANFASDTYELTVGSTEGGEVVEPGEGNFEYDAFEEVELEAAAGPGYHFVEWTGDIDNVEDPGSHETTIIMESDHEITANFASKTYELTVGSTEGGSVTEPGEGIFEYEHGEVVDLEAVVEGYHHFVGWSGDTENIDDADSISTTITMKGDHTITAEFSIDTYTLTIESSEGGGVVEPGEDTFEYEHGTLVTLEALAEEGWYFVEWTGDTDTVENTSANQTTIEMFDHYEITAEFAVNFYDLTINIEGEGSVERELDQEGYEHGTEVTLTATPEEGYEFVEWTGDVESTDEEITVLMDDHKEITAHFLMDAYFDIEILSPEEGSEYVEGDEVLVEYTVTNLGDIEDTQTISFTVHDEDGELVFDDQDRVTIGTLLSEDVYQGEFVWDIEEGLVGEFTLTISNENEEKEVTITVSERVVIYELNVEVEGEGIVALDPDQDGFEEGTEVTLTAVPEEGHGFVEWTGDHEGTEEEIDIVMDSDKSITARFEELQLSLEIVSPYDGDISDDSTITVKWDSENAAHHEVRLNGEDRIDVGQETSYTFEELESGEHTIEIRAVLGTDIFVEESVNIIVDTVIPHLEITYPEAGEEFTERKVTVGWDSSDDISGINYLEVRIGGGDWIEVGSDNYTFEYLEEGEHTVEVRAWDNAGNHASEEVTFTIEDEEEPSFSDRFCSLWWILLLLVLVVVVALFVYKRRDDEEEEEDEDEEGYLKELQVLESEEVKEEGAAEREKDEEPGIDEIGEKELPLEDEEEFEEAEENEEEIDEEDEIVTDDTEMDIEAEIDEELTEEDERDIDGDAISLETEGEGSHIDDEIFYECHECGLLIMEEEEDECPYCGTPIKREKE